LLKARRPRTPSSSSTRSRSLRQAD
jgi:hypothetical protein